MITVSLNNEIRKCEHCSTHNIKRTFELNIDGQKLYIGRICISKIVKVDTSGNPARVARKLQRKLNEMYIKGDISVEDFVDN